MDRILDSDYYSDDEMVEGDEDENITISFQNMTEEQFLAEEDMTIEELQEKWRPHYEYAKKHGLSYHTVRLNQDDEDEEDDFLCGELDIFEDEY